MIILCQSCHAIFQLDDSLIKPDGSKVRCSKCAKTFRVYQPVSTDRRKHRRVRTRNLISYFSFDKTGKLASHGLGIALDISRGGILLETPDAIKAGLLILAATDRENNLIEVKARLKYCSKTSTGTYFCGIEFTGIDERVRKFITKLIKEYKFYGQNLFMAVSQKIGRINPPHTPS
jgi:predicted Zn finger-like uncharacterized protein